MSDLEMEFSFDEKTSHFSQAGQISEPSLIQLRDQIKKVMIPILIKIFQLKLELSQSLSTPTRLQNQKTQHTPEEIIEQLKTLDNDLKALFLWCQSSRSQIQKALATPEEEQKNKVALAASTETNPAVSKSFSDAISAHSAFFQQNSARKSPEKAQESPSASSPKSWWEKLLRK